MNYDSLHLALRLNAVYRLIRASDSFVQWTSPVTSTDLAVRMIQSMQTRQENQPKAGWHLEVQRADKWLPVRFRSLFS